MLYFKFYAVAVLYEFIYVMWLDSQLFFVVAMYIYCIVNYMNLCSIYIYDVYMYVHVYIYKLYVVR